MLVLHPRPILFTQILQRRNSAHRVATHNLSPRQHFIRKLLRCRIPKPNPFLTADYRRHEYPPASHGAILQLLAGPIPGEFADRTEEASPRASSQIS